MNTNSWLISEKNGVRLCLQISAGAKTDTVIGPQADRLKIKISAPPVKGKANKALCKFLARELGIPKTDIDIIRGRKTAKKDVFVKSCSCSDVSTLLYPS